MDFDFVLMFGKINILILLTMSFSSVIVAKGNKPPKITRLDPKLYRHEFRSSKYNLVSVGANKYIMPQKYEIYASFYYNFRQSWNGITLVSFPNSGQLWVAEVVWLLKNNLDFTGSDQSSLEDKFILLEEAMLPDTMEGPIIRSPGDRSPSQKFLRTHLPLSLIPVIANSSSKIIYIARNPKDILDTQFREAKKNSSIGFTGRVIDIYWKFFQRNQIMYTPYWTHLHEGHNMIGKQNVLFLYIEEYPIVLIEKISKFLGTSYTRNQLVKVVAYMASKIRVDNDRWEFRIPLNDAVNQWIRQNIGKMWFPHIHLFST